MVFDKTSIEIIAGQIVEQLTVKEARLVAERGVAAVDCLDGFVDALVYSLEDAQRLVSEVEMQCKQAVRI
jgi:hypothetical protein